MVPLLKKKTVKGIRSVPNLNNWSSGESNAKGPEEQQKTGCIEGFKSQYEGAYMSEWSLGVVIEAL